MKATPLTRRTRSAAIALTDAIKDDLRALAQTFWDIGDKLRGAGLARLHITLKGDEVHVVVPRSRLKRLGMGIEGPAP